VREKFPIQPNFAFAYGSGVFDQIETKENKSMSQKDRPMVDYIFAVDDPVAWHKANLETNGDHYSAIQYAGADFIANIQENFGASIYFNTLVDVPEYNQKIKYGVISTSSLCRDLETWDTLYVSGRLHKPVRVIISPDTGKSEEATRLNTGLHNNLTRALNASLFLLPETFTKFELFETIVGLSYTGDMRVGIAENPRKVQNIVRGSFDNLESLYKEVNPQLLNASDTDTGKLHQDMSETARLQLLQSLPERFHQHDPGTLDREVLIRQLRQTIARSSKSQTIKGFLTAGWKKSAVYALQKLRKALR